MDNDGNIYRKVNSGTVLRVLADLNACSVADIELAYKRYEEYDKLKLHSRVPYDAFRRAKEEGKVELNGFSLITGKPVSSKKDVEKAIVEEEKEKQVKTKVKKETSKKSKQVEKGSVSKVKNTNSAPKTRFRYTYKQEDLDFIDAQLLEGVNWHDIYEVIFKGKTGIPTETSFREKCRKRKRALGIVRKTKEKKNRRVAIDKDIKGNPVEKTVVIPSRLTGDEAVTFHYNDKNYKKQIQALREQQLQRVQEAEDNYKQAIYDLARMDIAFGTNEDK